MEKAVLPLVMAALLAGCSVTPVNERGNPAPLQGTNWVLENLGTQPVSAQDSQRPPSIAFADKGNTVSGYDGCNRFSGTFSLYGQRMSFSPMLSTKMACLQTTVDQGYLASLKAVRSWQIKGSELFLMDADQKPLLTFMATGQ